MVDDPTVSDSLCLETLLNGLLSRCPYMSVCITSAGTRISLDE